MKKFYHLFFIVLLLTSLKAQVLLTEDFTSQKMAPDGWTIEGKTDNWKINPTTFAGGTFPECLFSYQPVGEGIYRLVSPELDTSNKTLLQLTFKQYFQKWSNSNFHKFGVATKSGGSDWQVVWETQTDKDITKEEKKLDITTNLNSSDFQFCFFFDGYTDDIGAWTIDDISLKVPLDNDVCTESVDIAQNVKVNTALTPKAVFKNIGSETISFPVVIDIYEGNQLLYSKAAQVGNLEPAQTRLVTFENFTPDKSNTLYKAMVCTDLSFDQDKSNDTTLAYFNTNEPEVKKFIIWESFTNTGCGPCASINPVNEKVINENLDTVIPMFLHTSWPSSQDPFYTPIKTVLNERTKYYNVGSVPSVIINGKATNILGDEQKLKDFVSSEKEILSAIKLNVMGNISGGKYISTVNIEVLGGMAPGNYKLQVGITESDLSFDAPNGEKHFTWVLRNLYPSETGTPVDIATENKITKVIECDLDASWKEDNLELFAFIQNDDTKEILQAAKIQPLTDVDEIISDIPEKYSLEQNYPNPFNPSTSISYQIVETVNVHLVVYDILGRKIKTLVNEVKEPGHYKVTFEAENFASGIYFYKLQAGDFTDIKKMSFIK